MPYEKGFHFLYYLERLIGREHFDKFIPHYFNTWAGKSLDSFEFKKTFLDFFEGYGNAEIKEKIATIPWEERFFSPGLPPKPDFNTAYVDSCLNLAEKWKQGVRTSQPVNPRRAHYLEHLALTITPYRITSPRRRTSSRSRRTRWWYSYKLCRRSRRR